MFKKFLKLFGISCIKPRNVEDSVITGYRYSLTEGEAVVRKLKCDFTPELQEYNLNIFMLFTSGVSKYHSASCILNDKTFISSTNYKDTSKNETITFDCNLFFQATEKMNIEQQIELVVNKIKVYFESACTANSTEPINALIDWMRKLS